MPPTIDGTAAGSSLKRAHNRISAPMDFFDAIFGSAEMDLLLACCKRALGGMDDIEFLGYIGRPFDSVRFIELCSEHRLMLIVRKALVNPFRHLIPADMANRFDAEAVRIAQKQLRMDASILEIHRALADGGLRHVFLKGPVLNRILFGDEILRYSKDLDVLIEPHNLPKADALLRKAGFHPKGNSADLRLPSRLFRLHLKDLSYFKNGMEVELHWKSDMVESIVSQGLFDWEKHISHCLIREAPIPVLADFHHCLYLCLHAAKHDWSRLRWLLDIPLLMRKCSITPEGLMALADRHGLCIPAIEAMFLCERLFAQDSGYVGFDPGGKNALRLASRMRTSLLRKNERIRSGKKRTAFLVFQKAFLYRNSGKKSLYWVLVVLDHVFIRISRAKSRLLSRHSRPARPTP